MSGSIATSPAVPGDPSQPFWDALREGRFLLHVCETCGAPYWPASCCVRHGAAAMRWRPGSGRGVIETFTIFHRAYRPELRDRIPYVVAVIRLDEGPYFHTNIVGDDGHAVRIGDHAEWIGGGADAEAGRVLFRLRQDQQSTSATDREFSGR